MVKVIVTCQTMLWQGSRHHHSDNSIHHSDFRAATVVCSDYRTPLQWHHSDYSGTTVTTWPTTETQYHQSDTTASVNSTHHSDYSCTT